VSALLLELLSTVATNDPRSCIVHRTGSKYQRTKRGSADPTFVNDPREHRERRDGHRGADKEHRLDARNARSEKPPERCIINPRTPPSAKGTTIPATETLAARLA